MKKIVFAFFALLALLLSSCAGDPIEYKLTLSPKDIELMPGETVRIKPSLTPEAADVVYTYKSLDTEVATVTASGNVTAEGVGDTRINVTATIGDQTVTAHCFVTVTKTRLLLSESKLGLFRGDEAVLTAKLSDGSAATVTWKSDNTAVATVTDGTVKALSTGEANITASCKYDGETLTATCKVSVVSEFTVTPSSAAMMKGQTLQLESSVSGAEWSTGDASVASVDANGLVTALANGSATITATLGSHSAKCDITVSVFTIKETTAGVGVGKTVQLHTNAPADASVTWSSSSAAVATVSESGLVSGIAAGSATITASYAGATATCQLTVSEPITLSEHECDLYEGYSVTLTANVPSDQITWSLDAYDIDEVPVTIDNGVVSFSATVNNPRWSGNLQYVHAVAEYNGVTDTCKLRCLGRPQWNYESSGLTIDESISFEYNMTLYPYNLTDFTYSFSNSNVVSWRERTFMDKCYDGTSAVMLTITPKAIGSVLLTATYKGSNPYLKGMSSTVKITVTGINPIFQQ